MALSKAIQEKTELEASNSALKTEADKAQAEARSHKEEAAIAHEGLRKATEEVANLSTKLTESKQVKMVAAESDVAEAKQRTAALEQELCQVQRGPYEGRERGKGELQGE